MFVCTGNTCRSPMASGIAKNIFKDTEVDIISRGVCVYTNSAASENAICAMNSMNIDLSKHISKQVTITDISESNLIFTMTNNHKNILLELSPESASKIFTLTEYIGTNKDILDPFGLSLDYYILCALELEKYILLIKNTDYLNNKAI